MSGTGREGDAPAYRPAAAGSTRLTKACVACRRQKMKCEPERAGPCKRCRRNNIECLFIPRANARQPDAAYSSEKTVAAEDSSSDVLGRLAVIESILGISRDGPISPDAGTIHRNDLVTVTSPDEDEGDPALSGLWQAAVKLRRANPTSSTNSWSRAVVSQLWLSFYANMEDLHFQSEREASNNPTPLLLAAILYVSALHHPSEELAALAPDYFRATCYAISELAIPDSLKPAGDRLCQDSSSTSTVEQAVFQNILGLILAGLISEAFIDLTGIWISIGYRLILDHCPVYIDHTANKWRQLFSGLQIIDLEHASLHLSSTTIPVHAPLPSLRQLQSFTEDPFHRLTSMMHTGLGHFTGRGLPTIWTFVSSSQAENATAPVFPFTERDAQIIKEWAKNLDDWLVSSHGPSNTAVDAIQIRRQYNLHRLFVLSIYHPARGFNLFANTVASAERHELLLSARATLRLQKTDQGIWANWDLVMITWAAILVLQGAEGGVGEHEDLLLVQDHLNKLKRTKRPAPSLHHTLASRLENWLDKMNISSTAVLSQPEFDPSWSLFDQNSIQIASEVHYPQQEVMNSADSIGSSADTTLARTLSMENQNDHNYDNSDYWNAYGNGIAYWPPGFSRVFGNPFTQGTQNDGHIQ